MFLETPVISAETYVSNTSSFQVSKPERRCDEIRSHGAPMCAIPASCKHTVATHVRGHTSAVGGGVPIVCQMCEVNLTIYGNLKSECVQLTISSLLSQQPVLFKVFQTKTLISLTGRPSPAVSEYFKSALFEVKTIRLIWLRNRYLCNLRNFVGNLYQKKIRRKSDLSLNQRSKDKKTQLGGLPNR